MNYLDTIETTSATQLQAWPQHSDTLWATAGLLEHQGRPLLKARLLEKEDGITLLKQAIHRTREILGEGSDDEMATAVCAAQSLIFSTHNVLSHVWSETLTECLDYVQCTGEGIVAIENWCEACELSLTDESLHINVICPLPAALRALAEVPPNIISVELPSKKETDALEAIWERSCANAAGDDVPTTEQREAINSASLPIEALNNISLLRYLDAGWKTGLIIEDDAFDLRQIERVSQGPLPLLSVTEARDGEIEYVVGLRTLPQKMRQFVLDKPIVVTLFDGTQWRVSRSRGA